MLKAWNKVFRVLARALDILIGVLMIVLVVVIGMQIVSRFVFNKPLIWTEEFARWLMIWMAFLAIPVCVKKNIHLKVDLGLDRALPPAGLLAKDILLNAVALVVWALIVKYGYAYAMTLTRVNALTFRIVKVYLLICIPVSGVLTVAFLLDRIIAAAQKYSASRA